MPKISLNHIVYILPSVLSGPQKETSLKTKQNFGRRQNNCNSFLFFHSEIPYVHISLLMPIISHVNTLMKFIAAIIKVKFLETVINNLCLQRNVQFC